MAFFIDMSICICQRAKLSKRGEALSREDINSLEGYIHVKEDEAYITVVCDDCDGPMYIKLRYCPICGVELLTNKTE